MKKQTKVLSPEERVRWFRDARFGLFIHWGLYAMPARHEWIRNWEHITNEQYQVYFDRFDPDLFEPREWAKAAKAAGMKYFVITTKHHEGFCLWDSKYTDYKATNTPAGHDLLREIVDAFRAEGLKVGFYYSLIDWHHPDFTIDANHPLRELEDAAEQNKKKDMRRYAKYMRDQVTELLTNYGPVDILWFDFSYPNHTYRGLPGKGKDDWESEKLLKLVRKLAPNAIIDNRLDLQEGWDIFTPEQFQPAKCPMKDGKPLTWEGCQTLSGSWGYHRDEMTWKSAAQCVEMLIKHVSRGGNLIMNVGPTARGYIDDRAMERLRDYADWMKFNARSIYGCGEAPAEFQEPQGCAYTYNPATRRLYLHIFDWPFERIVLPDMAGKAAYVQFLHDGSEIRTSETHKPWNPDTTAEKDLTIYLPVRKPNIVVPTVEIYLK